VKDHCRARRFPLSSRKSLAAQLAGGELSPPQAAAAVRGLGVRDGTHRSDARCNSVSLQPRWPQDPGDPATGTLALPPLPPGVEGVSDYDLFVTGPGPDAGGSNQGKPGWAAGKLRANSFTIDGEVVVVGLPGLKRLVYLERARIKSRMDVKGNLVDSGDPHYILWREPKWTSGRGKQAGWIGVSDAVNRKLIAFLEHLSNR
jgi:hypothetical protein